MAVVLPAVTVMEAGTMAEAEFELRETAAPPVGAGAVRVTVPWELAPPMTETGFKETESRVMVTDGVKVRVADWLTLL